MKDRLHELTIAETASLFQARKLSPVELTEALLERVAKLDPQLNALITVTAELAREQARRAESEIAAAGGWRGPLHGVPYGLKDIYNTAGILTSGHSRVGSNHIPAANATVTAKLEAAGAVLVGKLATYQFTHGGPSFDPPWPPARNPWNTAHDAGGSSSGSASAVAAGFVPIAMGSDTGGSVRIPASFCGVAGLKPTYGRVSRAGVITNSFTFDHCGPLTRTVEDCAIVLQAIAGFDPADPSSAQHSIPDYCSQLGRSIEGLRVGVLRHFWEEDLPANDEVCAAMEEALRVLATLGARVEEARMRPLQAYYDVKNVITKSEIFCVHQRDLGARAADYGRDFLGTTLGGCLFQAVDYVQAQRELSRMRSELEALYENFDVLVTANVGPAPRIVRKPPVELWQANRSPASMCIPFNVSAGPALSVCNGFTRDGLPLAMQIAGRPFDECTVLQVGHAYERATSWHERRPRLDPKAAPARAPEPPQAAAPATLDDFDLEYATWLARRAKLDPDAGDIQQLCALMPYADAMAARLREMRSRTATDQRAA